MDAIPYELHRESVDPGLIAQLAASHPRIGLDGLLAERGRRVHPGRVPAEAAVEGFRWGLRDGWSTRWWPQGVELLDGDDAVLVVSWFAQQRTGRFRRDREPGARITVVDRRDRRHPRAHHVLLVEPVRDEASDADTVRMKPVAIHAGGIAIVGRRLYAAATYGGLRVFELDDVLQVGRPGSLGAHHVLPQLAHERLRGARPDHAEERIRFSFVSVERVGTGDRSGDGPGDEHLVVGEFGPQAVGRRLARVPLAELRREGPTELIEVHEPGIPRMQGAAAISGTWFVSASNGLDPGDLWVGSAGAWVRHRGVLPPGPEDLAATADGSRLWSLCEYPRRRWVFAIDTARWRPATDGTAPAAAAAR